MNLLRKIKPILLLLLLLIGFLMFFALDFDQYFTFETLKTHRTNFLLFVNNHYFFTVGIFIITYICIVATSIPGAIFLSLLSGFLFGILLGTSYAVISATIGATILFFAVQQVFEPYLFKNKVTWIQKMRNGFQRNAFQYLLFIRLIPIFPFWIVNIVSALFGINIYLFITATFFGIIPSTLIYTSLGKGLGKILDRNQIPNFNIIFEPEFLLPLIAFAILIILPNIYYYFKRIHK